MVSKYHDLGNRARHEAGEGDVRNVFLTCAFRLLEKVYVCWVSVQTSGLVSHLSTLILGIVIRLRAQSRGQIEQEGVEADAISEYSTHESIYRRRVEALRYIRSGLVA
jgi:hypothetical protein